MPWADWFRGTDARFHLILQCGKRGAIRIGKCERVNRSGKGGGGGWRWRSSLVRGRDGECDHHRADPEVINIPML